MRVVAVVCARNEENHLGETIRALKNQSFPISRIVVVNDGSTDKTFKIAFDAGCVVVNLPFHKESYVGKPLMAKVWNYGLSEAKNYCPDFVLVMGADHVISEDYLSCLLDKMRLDERLVVCSGVIDGEEWEGATPRGSGRLHRVNYWDGLNGLKYPVYWGWEEYVIFSALLDGFSVRCFPGVRSFVQRPTHQQQRVSYLLIPEMYAIGYSWLYILLKCVKGRISVSDFVRGFCLTRSLDKLSVSGYGRQFSNRKIVSSILNFTG